MTKGNSVSRTLGEMFEKKSQTKLNVTFNLFALQMNLLVLGMKALMSLSYCIAVNHWSFWLFFQAAACWKTDKFDLQSHHIHTAIGNWQKAPMVENLSSWYNLM